MESHQPQYTEPTPISDRDNPFESMMRQAFQNVCAIAREYNVSLRIAAYVLTINQVAKTLRVRGIYA